MPQAVPVPDNSRIIMPYLATPSEMKRRWVPTAEGVYASPELARDESGDRIVKIDWPSSLAAARLASERTGRVYFLPSYGEALDAIRAKKAAEKEAAEFAEWTRNRYETKGDHTLIFSHRSHDEFEGVELDHALQNGYIASLRLGAPDAVSEEPNPDFLNAQLYYGNNPVIRGWYGRFYANANYGASYAHEDLGFRLLWYEKKEAERILKEHNKALKQEASDLRRKIAAARISLG